MLLYWWQLGKCQLSLIRALSPEHSDAPTKPPTKPSRPRPSRAAAAAAAAAAAVPIKWQI